MSLIYAYVLLCSFHGFTVVFSCPYSDGRIFGIFSSPNSILSQDPLFCKPLSPKHYVLNNDISVSLIISGSDLWSNGMEKIPTTGVFHFF